MLLGRIWCWLSVVNWADQYIFWALDAGLISWLRTCLSCDRYVTSKRASDQRARTGRFSNQPAHQQKQYMSLKILRKPRHPLRRLQNYQ
ncbi:hypothetical protein BDV19DRAFT_354485 [Aspergillus venezuelensis]